MNTRPAIESSSSPVALSASFNEDATCFAVGLENGFSIFNSEPFKLNKARELSAGIASVAMFGKSNYLALIGGGKNPKFPQNKVIIWNDSAQKVTIQIPVVTTVRSVRLSRSFIVVALQNSIRVYKFQKSPDIWQVFQTADNPLGLCCLTPTFLVIPGLTPGQVRLVELATKNVSIIPAHGSPLRAIDISRDGEILATASETGTLVRVYATSNCAKLAELRRGVDHATIFSVAISPSGQLLAVTSDKSTLHIFDIPHPTKGARADPATRRLTSQSGGSAVLNDGDTSQKWGILGRISLLPRIFSDVYSFASHHFEMGDEPTSSASIPPSSSKGVIGWTSDQTLMVVGAGQDGRWEKFIVAEGEDGKRYIVRDGWKKYLGVS